MDAVPSIIDRVNLLVPGFAERAPSHDRAASFPFENFQELSEAGLLALPVPKALGGVGAGVREAARVVNAVGKADAATALVLAMHYIHHLVITRNGNWPAHLAQRVSRDAVNGSALINALRVEPDQGSPSRGGLPQTTAKRTAEGWRITGRKIYSTGAPILKWYTVWAKTDEPDVRVGIFLVPAGLPGTEIVETWDHLGLRASGSHDVVFDDVLLPLDHEVDLRRPGDWGAPDVSQATIQAVLVGAVYDGVARAARDWLIDFLKTRTPSSLGAPLATLPRAQEIVGGIEAKLAVNARLLDTFARDIDDGVALTPIEANILKLTVTNNAVAAVEDALSLTSNHGLTRANPLERHYRDVLCGRVHTPQDDSTRISAGRIALGI
ncbi:Acyl-CoA dehydrogenase [Tardiphaga sp. OK246]|jgi:alkylation response protein AidB-like acyl-CoA dehydrogenase|uniref:acyl-CoA dehydrogenase family protein n=1 Tax=Tardiphaga sp. OK246 TaxID=1855307 RepID=UPI000B6C05F3|nr:acyl-CoA dehydrogenase family protein [Tardiphaga sp. OK246]SNT10484.1 Acyl-CoA dehydrogenase [Tardiphaga sp. OK246]